MTYGELEQAVVLAQRLLVDSRVAAIMMENSPAWIIMDLACIATNITLLPLPSFFSEKQIQHALRDAGVGKIFTDQPERFTGEAEEIYLADKKYYSIKLSFVPKVLPKNTAKITYTSGTTDEPKGVCLTQDAMEKIATGLLNAIEIKTASRHVCLLPLGVLLENVAGVYTALLSGSTVCLPPVIHEPQALYNAITSYNATSCILVPELLRMLLSAGKPLPTLSYAAVGGARISPELLNAAISKNIPVYEGYGLSEASSVVAVNTPDNNKIGSVGRLLPHIKMRIGDDGELFLHRPLFSGYLGDSSPDQEWYATGDIGHIDEDGFLHIEGRKKNIYITSFGRNISPEWLESLMTAHPVILQAFVFGEAKPFSTAIIVSRNPQAIADAIADLNQKLPDYARIGKYIFAKEPFSIANGQLTGTGRPRRKAIYEVYKNAIEECYRQEASI
jgi:long-chain acyl-CoA synthetase